MKLCPKLFLTSVVLCFAYYTGESSCKITTETDSSDHTEHPHDDKLWPDLSSELKQDSSAVVNSMIHNEEKMYHCYVCDKLFNHSGHLNAHMRVHTGEKPYKCSLCNKSYTWSSGLWQHKRSVHGNECNKSENENVVVDSRIDDEEKLYKCHMCQKAFIQSYSLTSHMTIHTGEQPYQYECLLCHKRFTRPSDLQSHKHRMHSSSVDALKSSENIKFECVGGDWSVEDKEENLPFVKQEPNDVHCVCYFVLHSFYTHTIVRFIALLEFVRDYLGEQVPER